MDRCVLLVDAGYVLAQSGTLLFDTNDRSDVSCAYPKLLAGLQSYVATHAQFPVLRVYWYDGARDAIPTTDQLAIAALPNVKLRLGRIVGSRQKGVDSLIIRDLMTLARERAVVTAYLLGGDEDLREGMLAAQDMGVRVVLLGIEAKKGNQADTLIRESDEHLVLPKDWLKPHFALAAQAEMFEGGEAGPQYATPEAVGAAFADAWAEKALGSEILELLGRAPRIPRELDVRLIQFAERHLGSLRERPDVKPNLRAQFWQRLLSHRPTSADGPTDPE